MSRETVNYEKREIPMTDFQYKNLIEMIYQIMKANFEAGKTPEEVLAIIAALKNEPIGEGHE